MINKSEKLRLSLNGSLIIRGLSKGDKIKLPLLKKKREIPEEYRLEKFAYMISKTPLRTRMKSSLSKEILKRSLDKMQGVVVVKDMNQRYWGRGDDNLAGKLVKLKNLIRRNKAKSGHESLLTPILFS